MLRLSRTVSAAVRVATVDTQILGHHIPKGNSVIMLLNGWSSLGGPGFEIDEEARGLTGKDRVRSWDDADIREFRPERWLVPDGTATGKMVFDQNAGPSLPMSAGPRGCFGTFWITYLLMGILWDSYADTIQGKRLAHLELRLAIVTLVLAFEFLAVPSALDTEKATEVVTRQPNDCFVRLRLLV
jgi:cytochrome P450